MQQRPKYNQLRQSATAKCHSLLRDMRLSSLTTIGFCANMAIDHKKQAKFSFDDLYEAAEKGRLVSLLMQSLDDSGIIELWARDDETREEVERSLTNAIEALRGREIGKTGIGDNPLCMVIAIVLEAIQENFH